MYQASYRPGAIDHPAYIENHHSYNESCLSEENDIISESQFSPNNAQRHSTKSSFVESAVGIGGRLFNIGRAIFLQQRQCVQMGEGPSLVRLLCFLGGLAMLVSSSISMLNIFSLFTGPSTYVLQAYQGFFGVITMVVEAKDWDCFDQFKPWLVDWFKFLTVPAGKGAFYIFVGSLGISLWVRNFMAFTVGLYMAFMGCVCLAVHAGGSSSSSFSNNLQPFRDEESADMQSEMYAMQEDDEEDGEEGIQCDQKAIRHNTSSTSAGSFPPGTFNNSGRSSSYRPR